MINRIECGEEKLMKERTIMIFPRFENIDIIDEIRRKYDPLSNLVRPHITLVFPFKSEVTTEALSDQIKKAVKGISPFEIELGGFSTQQDKFGNYLFLNVKRGEKYLKQLNYNLYDGKSLFSYCPHMTVGKFDTIDQLESAYNDVKDCTDSFTTVVDTVSVEEIGEHGESIIEIEIDLGS